ncbi:MAG TPA: serine protease, partial [Lentzea sp.]
MTGASYWVDLRTSSDDELGAGFYFTSRYLLTAEHCLRQLPADDHCVRIVHDDGTVARGLVCARDEDADLALISLLGLTGRRPPPADVCARDDRWRTPSRPKASDPHLSGVVNEPSADFHCAGGAVVKALQLQSDLVLGNYNGYSGSAVERLGKEPRLAGVIVEQYLDRQSGDRATNVLFAITMHEAMERFADHFQHSGSAPAAVKPEVTCSARVMDLLATYTEMLRHARDWQAQGLMSPAEVQMIQVNIARTIVESTIK